MNYKNKSNILGDSSCRHSRNSVRQFFIPLQISVVGRTLGKSVKRFKTSAQICSGNRVTNKGSSKDNFLNFLEIPSVYRTLGVSSVPCPPNRFGRCNGFRYGGMGRCSVYRTLKCVEGKIPDLCLD
ncbi:hypothetical protein AVEN_64982-1 [Araneus ventricosus]|uniref:Uncharacterized protein n=1 Tax=Araneus ventricosus TaxID=182803 RepID=A0A4Y2QFH9_ARAVE|nr:hypothetical protein AVEN_64982-1 [Araneus ventricosus]